MARPKPLVGYEDDYYTWLIDQAALLRGGRLADADVLTISEELLDMAKSEYRAMESAFARLIQHLLKWDYQPERRTRSWLLSIREHRRRIEKTLKDSPGLKARLDEAVLDSYDQARDWAAEETGLRLDVFPQNCPYGADDLLTRDFSGEFRVE